MISPAVSHRVGACADTPSLRVKRGGLWRTSLFSVVVSGWMLCAVPAEAEVERIELDNGVVVLLERIPGLDRVGIETIYRVGFVDEPEGLPQSAHLLEHLSCKCATDSYEAGKVWNMLNAGGVFNAETLASWTHFDYSVAPERVEQVLEIESERIRGLRIDPDTLKQEIPRCYREARMLQERPTRPVGKFAIMAALQAWRFGRDEALVVSGLDKATPERIAAFHKQTYRPHRLIVAISGSFDRDAVLEQVRRHLGSISPAAPEPARRFPDYTKLPRRTVLRWDLSVPCVFVCYPPPAEQAERVLLTLFGNALNFQVGTDPKVRGLAASIQTTSNATPAGPLPVITLAAMKAGDPAKVGELLAQRTEETAAAMATPELLSQIRMSAHLLAKPLPAATADIQRLARRAGRRKRTSQPDAAGLVLLQRALNAGSAELLLGPDREATLRKLDAIGPEAFKALIKHTFDPAHRSMTLLLPREEGES